MATLGATLSSEVYPSGGTVETVTPTTAQSIVIGNSTNIYIVNPAGTLAALTITMPAAPSDKQILKISTSQIITSLTLSANSGQTILNVPTTFILGGFAGFIYIAANTKWYRIS